MLKRTVIAFAVALAVAFAITGSGTATEATESIDVGEITGSHGYEGDTQVTVYTSGDAYMIRADYGFHCVGKTCLGNDDPPELTNHLSVTLTRAQGDHEAHSIHAWTMMGKSSELQTQDWDCPPPAGPPTWNATASVTLSGPYVGGGAGAPMGAIEDNFQHTASPTTAWYKSHAQDPIPPGLNGTTYALQSSEVQDFGWPYDPQNPTATKTVKADVKTDFRGDAKEIDVVKCKLKCPCSLHVSW